MRVFLDFRMINFQEYKIIFNYNKLMYKTSLKKSFYLSIIAFISFRYH